jgi:hypothetical protein
LPGKGWSLLQTLFPDIASGADHLGREGSFSHLGFPMRDLAAFYAAFVVFPPGRASLPNPRRNSREFFCVWGETLSFNRAGASTDPRSGPGCRTSGDS